MISVFHYGVHWAADGIAYLEQARGGTNAVGKLSKSPFRVTPLVPGTGCNHLITLNLQAPAHKQLTFISEFIHDELLKVMAPVPRTPSNPFFLRDDDDASSFLISLLSKMSTPIEPVSYRAGEITEPWLERELQMTNVQPLVLRQCTQQNSGILRRLTQLAPSCPRTVLAVGDATCEFPDNVVRIGTNLMRFDQERLLLLPWESIGAMFLRSYMKGEWRDGWIAALPRAGDMRRESRTNPRATHDLGQLIARGEGQHLEFKSTFQYCLKTNKKEAYIRKEIPAAVAAFMNSEGGTLLIGVADDGSVLGIEHDLMLEHGAWDRLLRQIVQTIATHLGANHLRRCKIQKVQFAERELIRIVVDRSHEPIFLDDGKQEFYIRAGSTTRKLEGRELLDYTKDHFPYNGNQRGSA